MKRISGTGMPLLFAAGVFFCLFTINNVCAQEKKVNDLEKRVEKLEKRVRNLELQLDRALNPAKYSKQKVKTAKKPRRAGVVFLKSPLEGRLVRKNMKLAEPGEVNDNLALLITFKNNGAAGIVSFKGDIIFKDVYQDSILSFYAEIEKAIPAGMSNTWFGGIPYDAANEAHRKLLDTGVDKIKVIVRPEVIVFSDGTMKSYRKDK